MAGIARPNEENMKTELSKYLSPSRLENIICLEEAESTNTYLKSLAPSASCGQAVIALRQKSGRGRQGNSFSSPEGGIYLSILYRLGDFPAEVMPCAAVAVARAVKQSCGIALSLKWVNDLIWQGKKLGGILAEKEGDGLIIGIGLNVNTPAFPPELPNAASLFSLSGKHFDLAALTAAIIKELDALAEGYPQNLPQYKEQYTALCLNIGREVRIIRGGEHFTAYAEAIEDDFSLLVRHSDGQREKIFFGEVSIRKPDGNYV